MCIQKCQESHHNDMQTTINTLVVNFKQRMYNMQTVLFNLTNIVDIPHSDTLNSPSECNQS
jgi:hypothetical protein